MSQKPPIYTIRRYGTRDGIYRHLDTYDDMLSLSFTDVRNGVGVLAAEFSARHRVVIGPTSEQFQPGDRLEVWREWPGVLGLSGDHYMFSAFYMDDSFAFNGGQESYMVNCLGHVWLLSTRDVAYRSSVLDAGRLVGYEASDAMRRVVEMNFTSEAIEDNEREVDGVPVGYTINIIDDGQKSTIVRDWDVYHKGALPTLQDIATTANLDFDLVRTNAPTVWEFRVYGTDERDVSEDVVFSLENDNMANPRLIRKRSDTFTVALVGGKGEGPLRVVLPVFGNNWSPSNHIERFIAARTSQSELSLQAVGEQALRDARPVETIEFDLLQTDFYRYRRDYRVGWKIGAAYRGVRQVQRVDSAQVSWTRSNNTPETIQIAHAPL